MKMDLRELGCGGMDWIDLVQDRDLYRVLVNMVMNLQVPENIEKFLSSFVTGSLSRRVHLHEVSYPSNCLEGLRKTMKALVYYARFVTLSVKFTVFRDVIPCSVIDNYQRFRGPSCL
jgi:hypothetical protein